jgi:hypothetical protein
MGLGGSKEKKRDFAQRREEGVLGGEAALKFSDAVGAAPD